MVFYHHGPLSLWYTISMVYYHHCILSWYIQFLKHLYECVKSPPRRFGQMCFWECRLLLFWGGISKVKVSKTYLSLRTDRKNWTCCCLHCLVRKCWWTYCCLPCLVRKFWWTCCCLVLSEYHGGHVAACNRFLVDMLLLVLSCKYILLDMLLPWLVRK